jgi:hypothetical protein
VGEMFRRGIPGLLPGKGQATCPSEKSRLAWFELLWEFALAELELRREFQSTWVGTALMGKWLVPCRAYTQGMQD